MILNQAAGNGQAEANTVGFCGIEWLKDPFKDLWSDPCPGIAFADGVQLPSERPGLGVART